jgi:hypothetical protein
MEVATKVQTVESESLSSEEIAKLIKQKEQRRKAQRAYYYKNKEKILERNRQRYKEVIKPKKERDMKLLEEYKKIKITD